MYQSTILKKKRLQSRYKDGHFVAVVDKIEKRRESHSSLVALFPPESPQRVGVERHRGVRVPRAATARRDLEHLDVLAHRADGEVVFEVAGAHHLQLVGQADVALAPARAERDHGGWGVGRRGRWQQRGVISRCRAAIAN